MSMKNRGIPQTSSIEGYNGVGLARINLLDNQKTILSVAPRIGSRNTFFQAQAT